MSDKNKTKIQILSAEVDDEGLISIDSDIIDDITLLNAMYNPVSGKLTVLYAVMVYDEEEVEEDDNSSIGGELSNGVKDKQETEKESEG